MTEISSSASSERACMPIGPPAALLHPSSSTCPILAKFPALLFRLKLQSLISFPNPCVGNDVAVIQRNNVSRNKSTVPGSWPCRFGSSWRRCGSRPGSRRSSLAGCRDITVTLTTLRGVGKPNLAGNRRFAPAPSLCYRPIDFRN